MKPVDFRYVRPTGIADTVRILKQAGPAAKIVAGGQSLGPMLNLRLAQPDLLVDITAIPELTRVREDRTGIVYGACITHAAFEDGRVPDITGGYLQRVAGDIAYRAVRNRGTIGGSLAHADPAADWMTALMALGAELTIAGEAGERTVALGDFMETPYGVALDESEFVTGVRIAKFSSDARFGYCKFCRKRGEFAEAMSAIAVDRARGVCRGVIGATDSRPVVLDDIGDLASTGARGGDPAEIAARADEHVGGLNISSDPLKDAMHRSAFARAMRQVLQ